MPTRRGILQALACLPLASRGLFTQATPSRGLACALGERADASLLPPARREGESLALALFGSSRPAADELRDLTSAADSVWIELPSAEDKGADESPLIRRVRAAASVTLLDGALMDWLLTLWPPGRRSAISAALVECAVTGGRVIGRGAASLLVAAGGVARGPTNDEPGESRVRLANPRESGEPRLAHGLRLCEGLFVDTHARSGGSLLRLLSTLIENHEEHGMLLGARSVLCCDVETRDWSALGTDPVIFLDLSEARRRAESVERARLSVLAAGDGWRAEARRLSSTGAAASFGEAASPSSSSDGLSVAALLAPPLVSRVASDARTRVFLRQGSEARVFAGPEGAPTRAHHMLLDVTLLRGRFGELGV
ncbi:MAG TPA: hypothetical protein VM509_05090 [Planctomycetota bacterium]|nr:hypothetical protein [Planctomycetota bacterium]